MNLRISIILVLAIFAKSEGADKIICYYQGWNYVGIDPENLDANLCTHLNYAYINVDENGNLQPLDPVLEIDQGLYKRVSAMKKQNPDLKVLLNVGGGSSKAKANFIEISADSAKRAALIESANTFIDTYGFDGLDIDWEVPEADDKENFITLLRDINNNFTSKGFILSAAVTATPVDGYDIPEMSEYLDIINVMTYDMYGSWSNYTGQNSPLFASSLENEWESQNLNLAAGAQNWLNAGADATKLAMGVAFYGRSFTLTDPDQHEIHSPISGAGVGNDGELIYREICSNYSDWTRVWDDEQKNPYKYSADQWFGYDDTESLDLKVQYVKSNNLGGVMVWAIDQDDIIGVCGEKQALLKQINTSINKSRSK